jgi:hypothetical protein
VNTMQPLMNKLALCLLIFLTACTATAPAPTATSLPSATLVPSSTATPTSTATPLPTATATPRPTTTMPDPTPTTEASSTPTRTLEESVPTGESLAVWHGIPVMPGAISGGENKGSYLYKIKASNKAVQDYYRRELSKLGYSSFAVGTGDDGNLMLMYQKDSQMVVISVFMTADSAVVMIVPA